MGKKPNRYWSDKDRIRSVVDKLIRQLNRFPSTADFKRLKRQDVLYGIAKYHGGLNAMRKRMGYLPLKLQNGYWKKWQNVVFHLQPIMLQLKRFPTAYELKQLERQDLLGAITHHHGGLTVVRERFSLPAPKGRRKG